MSNDMKLIMESWRSKVLNEEYIEEGARIAGYHATVQKPEGIIGFSKINPETPQHFSTGTGFYLFRDKSRAIQRLEGELASVTPFGYEPYKDEHGYKLIVTLEVPYDLDILEVDSEAAVADIYPFIDRHLESFKRLEYDNEPVFNKVEKDAEKITMFFDGGRMRVFKKHSQSSVGATREIDRILYNMKVGNVGKLGVGLYRDFLGEILKKVDAFKYVGPPIPPTKVEIVDSFDELVDITQEVLGGDLNKLVDKLKFLHL